MKPRIFSTPAAAMRSRLFHQLSSYSAIGRGLLVCITIALATTFIADHYGGPPLLYALLFGVACNLPISRRVSFWEGRSMMWPRS